MTHYALPLLADFYDSYTEKLIDFFRGECKEKHVLSGK